jgi:hypothetical protein
MFGMLDYRAHKLFWLICWPLALANLVLGYCAVVASALYVRLELSSYHPLLRIVIAWVVAQLALLVLAILWAVCIFTVKRVFFWLIDIVPAHGADADDAKEVVLQGPSFALYKKLETSVDDWADKDTDALVRCMNWRARWFFPVKSRTALFVHHLQKTCWKEGKQPWQLPKTIVDDIRKLVGKPSWLEIAVTNPYIFHGALTLVVIAVIVLQRP